MPNQSGRLENKSAFITGSASGIGRATSDLFRKEGARVFNVDISYGTRSVRVGENLFERGADLRSEAQVKAALDTCIEAFGSLDIIVNCAGIEMKGTVVDLGADEFDRVMETNVKSTFLVCKYGVPLLLKSIEEEEKKNRSSSRNGKVGGPSIINLSSDLGIQPIPGVDLYSASKGAIISLTKAMSKNWARRGLRVNCVAPGPVDTPLLRRFLDEKSLSFVTEVMLPQGRLGTPEEVAAVIAYLASEDSSLINGAVITANGGLVG
jgi:meso-butanediol dehydrogenase/(S,S)-butanediol dehydrogenase/diacetyl reductase